MRLVQHVSLIWPDGLTARLVSKEERSSLLWPTANVAHSQARVLERRCLTVQLRILCMYLNTKIQNAEAPPGKRHVMSLRTENVRRTRILAVDDSRPGGQMKLMM